MTPTKRLAIAAAGYLAGRNEARAFFFGTNVDAYRDGWFWPEGTRALTILHQHFAPQAFFLAWEGGVCAFHEEDPVPDVALVPSPGTKGRSYCPGTGLHPDLMAAPGPALREMDEVNPVILPSPREASAHDRILWNRYLGGCPSPNHVVFVHGVVLRRYGSLVAAFVPGDPSPLAMRRLDR